MATQWYHKVGEEERGPVRFAELVQMICDGTLTEDDRVRPSYLADWERADSVPGLFYMARRRMKEAEERRAESGERRAEGGEERAESEEWAAERELLQEIAAEAAEEIPEPMAQTHGEDWRLSWGEWLFVYLIPDRLLSWLFRTREMKAPGVPSPSGAADAAHAAVASPSSRADAVATLAEPRISPIIGAEITGERIGNAEQGIDNREPDIELGHARNVVREASASSTTASEAAEAEGLANGEIREVIGEAVRRLDERRAAAARREKRRAVGAGLICGIVGPLIGRTLRILRVPITLAENLAAGIGRIAWLERLCDAASGWIERNRWFRQAFRLLCALAATNLTAVFLMNWSQKEALRYPGPEGAPTVQSLPVFGACAPIEYWFFFVDIVIAAGVLGYFVATWLERNAED